MYFWVVSLAIPSNITLSMFLLLVDTQFSFVDVCTSYFWSLSFSEDKLAV